MTMAVEPTANVRRRSLDARSGVVPTTETATAPKTRKAARYDGPIDYALLAGTMLLVAFGIVMVYSASAVYAGHMHHDSQYYLVRQSLYALVGFGGLTAAASWDYRKLRRFTYPLLGVTVFLLVVVVAGLGHATNGAARWIRLGPIRVQPAEIAKVTIVVWLAHSLSKKNEKIRTFSIGFLPHLLMAGILMMLCLKQPDMGSAVVLLLLTFILLFVAGARTGYILGAVLTALPVAWYLVMGTSYRRRRWEAFKEPFEDLDLELCRQSVRVLAARRASIEREESVVEALRPWAEAQTDPRARAYLIDWLGRLRYRQSRFEEAAATLDAGARPEASALHRMGALAGGASAWLEALRPDLAMARAQALRDEAARCRHVYFEAWAEHLLRASAYRAGVAMPPSADQVELLAMVGVKDLEALASLDEAANAWRTGDMDLTRAFATRSFTIWAASGWAPGACIARALAVAAGATIDRDDLEALVAWTLDCGLPRLGAQIVGLLSKAGVGDRAALREAARIFASATPVAQRDTRLEVLSIAEALACCEP